VTTTTGVAGLAYKVALPQWLDYANLPGFRVELYFSVTNPSAGADLFLVRTERPAFSANGVHTITVASVDFPSLPSKEPLYTGGNVLANEPPRANNGLAYAGTRVWTAEGSILYASKLVQPGSGPAWSSDDSLQIPVPTTYGQVRGLGSIDNLLVVLTDSAAYAFTGQGPGDAGGPSDFQDIRRVYRALGPAGAGDVSEASTTAVWSTSKGGAHAMAAGASAVNVGRATESSILRRPVFLLGESARNDQLAFLTADPRSIEVLDLGASQWSTWTFPYDILDLGTSARGFVLLLGEAPWVVELSGTSPVDAVASGPAVPFTLLLETRLMPLGHLGTVAKVRPQGKKTLEIDVDLGVSLLVDQGRAAVDGNTASFTVGAFAPTWPRSELPEFIPGQPVCESFAVKLEATPATVELTGVQVDLLVTGEQPRVQRK
jgi:hypothetical protein